MDTIVESLSETVRNAAARGTPLDIRGGGSKAFYGGPHDGKPLDVSPLRGIIDYEPPELVITARAGTPLVEISEALRAGGQMLAFEPPSFAPQATLGGCIAAGLAGPRRAYAGAVRDFVLGVRVLNGAGENLHFGGRVMKNVAGFDVSRLMAGSLGTLGVILEVSLKVLPLPATETTLAFELPAADAISSVNLWSGRPLPLSATAWSDGRLHVRLSGAPGAVDAAVAALGGERLEPARSAALWHGIREHTDAFFVTPLPLWRLSLKATTPPLNLPGPQLIEWGGALRWLATDADAKSVRAAAEFGGGHATLFRGGERTGGVFHPLSPALLALHRRLKQAFDPAGIFNPGRLYDGV